MCIRDSTRAGVTTRVIVGDDDRRHPLANQRTKDIRQTDDHAIDLPYRSNVTTTNPMTSIETKDVDRFLFGLTQFNAEDARNIRGCPNLKPQQWFQRKRPSTEFQRSLDLTGLGRTDPR